MFAFAIMYEAEGEKTFKPCKTLEQAQKGAQAIACMGITVTVFDFDMETNTYHEFYTI